MRAREVKRLRAELENKRRELLESYRRARQANLASADEGLLDLADRATESYTKEFLYSLTDVDRHMLRMVDEALGRIEEGTYGRCQSCGGQIGLRRLRAIPWAALCIECQEAQESGARK